MSTKRDTQNNDQQANNISSRFEIYLTTLLQTCDWLAHFYSICLLWLVMIDIVGISNTN
uniref:Uncharacterized protein n=1 Tax=Lepeophtheirus salmonis TaxID=72036 RepID=A0A0K2U721_LEPSM